MCSAAGSPCFSLVAPDAATTAAVAEFERAIGLRSVVVGAEGVEEEGQALSDWLKAAGVVAVLVRPDFYVFGTAARLSEVMGLLASLRVSLSLV
ncbi:hypothetical protein [Streptomyces hygroscopicus]|uniref:hypothetical protein n=1 Tax=Streptomyces hygroscopicus TaxID=1912 RepID=UPI0004C8D498|nr:hypothetical protein [Streptomyces hygroscopicus]